MKKFEKQVPITELISCAKKHMQEQRYSQHTMNAYCRVWSLLAKEADKTKTEFMTPEFGASFLERTYGIDNLYSETLNKYEKGKRRKVLVLLEFQITGRFFKRKNRYEYLFPEQYAQIGKNFMEHLKENLGLCDETQRNNFAIMEKFFAFMSFHGINSLKDVNIEIINAYSKTLAGYSKSHISRNIKVLSRFFNYVFENGEVDVVYQWPNVRDYKNKEIPQYYKPEEIKDILNKIDRANPLGKRDYAIILLSARYGLRVSDIKALTLSNIDFENNQINIIQQKTGKPLTLFLLKEVGWALVDYIKGGRPKSDSPNIFIRHTTPFCAFSYNNSLTHMMEKYAIAAGVRNRVKKKTVFI